MCIGDSVTFGSGAPAEFSYPCQLEGILNKSSPGRKYKVINAGIPGLTASEVREGLDNLLETRRPDKVILMAGNNDWWKVVKLSSRIPGGHNEIFIKINLALNKIFLFRLLNTASLNLSGFLEKIQGGRRPAAEYFYPEKQKDRKILVRFLKGELCDIIDKLKRRNTEVLMMTYPRTEYLINAVIRDVADALSIKLVNNEILFKNFNNSYFAEDMFHPNNYGYSLIALNIYYALQGFDYLIGEKLILDGELSKDRRHMNYDAGGKSLDVKQKAVNLDNLSVDLQKVYSSYSDKEKIKPEAKILSWSEDYGLMIITYYTVFEKFFANPGEFYLEIIARGTDYDNEYPQVAVNVGLSKGTFSEKEIGRFFVDKGFKVYKTNSFILDKKGMVYLFVDFINDKFNPGVADINLFIKSITFRRK